MPRVLLRSLLALVVAAGAVLIGWRVLAPAEVLSAATTPYPAAVDRAPGVVGRTNMAPLIVDGRIRVYAAKRQVRADGPADAKTVMTARWSFRRWPEQLAGVAASGRTVVSRWSDGELVAIDGRTGEIAWRADGPEARGFDGHRTGAGTVWAPPGLRVAPGVVVVSGGGDLVAYELTTGVRRWRISACADGFTTGGGHYVCPTGAVDLATGAPVGSWPAGPYTPLDCATGLSTCAAMLDGAGQHWSIEAAAPRRSAAPDYPDAQVLGRSNGNVVLLRPDRHLVEVDPRTGATLAEFPLAVGTERLTWKPGRWQVTDGFVAIERLAPDGPADPETVGHYFTTETVILAAL
ncbi:MAG: PQQ-binding-like beta-propeller repeat protein [Actinoplanes sp.]